MNTSRMRLIIIGAVFILIVLIRLVVSYSSQQSATTPTDTQPLITQAQITQQGNSTGQVVPTIAVAPVIVEAGAKRWNSLPTADRENIDAFVRTLPYSSREFDITYDSQIRRIIITAYSDHYQPSLTAYLQSHKIDALYASGSSIFIVSKHPADAVIKALRDPSVFEGDERGK